MDRFNLLASTIGPIDAGIVAILEDRFEKETGIRVRHVGVEKYGSPLFFPNSKEWNEAHKK